MWWESKKTAERVCSNALRSSETVPITGIAIRLTPAVFSFSSVSAEWTPITSDQVGRVRKHLLVVNHRLY